MFSRKVVVFGQKWLYSGKGGCIRAKEILFGQRCSIRVKCCIRAKVVVFGQIGCNWAIWLYSDRVVFFAKKLLYLSKMVIFGQKLLFSDKSACFETKWLEA